MTDTRRHHHEASYQHSISSGWSVRADGTQYGATRGTCECGERVIQLTTGECPFENGRGWVALAELEEAYAEQENRTDRQCTCPAGPTSPHPYSSHRGAEACQDGCDAGYLSDLTLADMDAGQLREHLHDAITARLAGAYLGKLADLIDDRLGDDNPDAMDAAQILANAVSDVASAGHSVDEAEIEPNNYDLTDPSVLAGRLAELDLVMETTWTYGQRASWLLTGDTEGR